VVEEGRVVLVQRRGLEDRVQVDRVHPQRLDVVELLEDALEVPAVAPDVGVPEEVMAVRLLPGLQQVPIRGPGGYPPVAERLVGPRPPEVCRFGIVPRIAVAEALGEDLVPDRVRGPGRRSDPHRRRRGGSGGPSRVLDTRARAEQQEEDRGSRAHRCLLRGAGGGRSEGKAVRSVESTVAGR
jgi:hypothetical protein